MRRYPIFLLLLLGLFLTGWGHEGPRVKVGLLLDDPQGKKAFLDRFRSELGSLNADLLMAPATKDPSRNASTLIDQGVQALVVFFDDPRALKGLMARVKGVPVLTVERPLPEAGQMFLVSYDPVKEGELMAGALLRRSPKGRLLLVGGGKGDWFSQQVRLGQRKALGSAIQEGDIRLVQKGWEGTEAFLADSQERTLGSRKKLRDLGRAGKVFLVGLGQDPDTCRAVLSGTQLATIYRSPLKLAEESAYLATKAARNAKTFDCQFADVPHEAGMVKTVLLTPKLLDRSNLLETLVKDGVYTKEQLEGKKP